MKKFAKSFTALMLAFAICLTQAVVLGNSNADNGIMPSSFLQDTDCTA